MSTISLIEVWFFLVVDCESITRIFICLRRLSARCQLLTSNILAANQEDARRDGHLSTFARNRKSAVCAFKTTPQIGCNLYRIVYRERVLPIKTLYLGYTPQYKNSYHRVVWNLFFLFLNFGYAVKAIVSGQNWNITKNELDSHKTKNFLPQTHTV